MLRTKTLEKFKNARLRVMDLIKKFNDKVIIDKVSFTVDPGDRLIIIGPSGSGKSTLLKLMCRLIEPDGGTIFLDDTNLLKMNVLLVRQMIIYVPQIPIMFEGTVRDNLLFAPKHLGIKVSDKDLNQAIIDVGLDSSYLDRVARNLSVGEKQRVALARALLLNPLILLLDEPTSHLDPENTAILENLILDLNTERRKTFIIVTHDYHQAKRLGNKIFKLENGKLKIFGM